jgi:hypothetical protein
MSPLTPIRPLSLISILGLLLIFSASTARLWVTPLWWYPLWAAVVVVLAAVVGMRFHAKAEPAPLEPLLGSLVALGALLLPAPRGVGIAAIVVAILLAQLLWAHGRYAAVLLSFPVSKLSIGQRVAKGVSTGALYALGFSLIAAVLFSLGSGSGRSPEPGYPMLGGVIAAYFVGGLTAGLAVGLLWQFEHDPIGTCILGVIGATCAYAAVGVSVDGLTLKTLETGVAIGGMVGPAMGLIVRLQWGGRT